MCQSGMVHMDLGLLFLGCLNSGGGLFTSSARSKPTKPAALPRCSFLLLACWPADSTQTTCFQTTRTSHPWQVPSHRQGAGGGCGSTGHNRCASEGQASTDRVGGGGGGCFSDHIFVPCGVACHGASLMHTLTCSLLIDLTSKAASYQSLSISSSISISLSINS
jgi:hypothetical protein